MKPLRVVVAPKVAESCRRFGRCAQPFNPGDEDLELAHFTGVDQLGESILKVAEASLRIDQLRWLHEDTQGVENYYIETLAESAEVAFHNEPERLDEVLK